MSRTHHEQSGAVPASMPVRSFVPLVRRSARESSSANHVACFRAARRFRRDASLVLSNQWPPLRENVGLDHRRLQCGTRGERKPLPQSQMSRERPLGQCRSPMSCPGDRRAHRRSEAASSCERDLAVRRVVHWASAPSIHLETGDAICLVTRCTRRDRCFRLLRPARSSRQ